MFVRVMLVLALLTVTACSEKEVLQYQGRPAGTALECKAAYEAAKSRTASVNTYSSGGSALGTLIGKSLVSGMTESHYNTCLSRVASLPSPNSVVQGGALRNPTAEVSVNPPATSSVPAPRATSVPQCNLTMVGGTGYACAHR